ncbi:hypothetical protein VNI00_011282 [Paramarasmius palmivorus]|uniref:Nephrocystin 3-like N-terminal domain-containing protein n=1 Tax=Paramarasmius palmivorus TaxID=297713 RepID=A0AAW0CE59_9AGAR
MMTVLLDNLASSGCKIIDMRNVGHSRTPNRIDIQYTPCTLTPIFFLQDPPCNLTIHRQLNLASSVFLVFTNSRNFHISGGHFSNVAGNVYHVDPLYRLWDSIRDVGAAHNSETRYPPPQCHPDTRKEVLNIIRTWVHTPSRESGVFWLYGPAGAGKSAIAQTIAERGQQDSSLASSFFFSRGDPRRNSAKYLFLTIAYGLAYSIPELRDLVGQAIDRNPALLQASLEEQFQKLIVEPCRLLDQLRDYPWLVIIDGLDECAGSREQQRILSIITTALSGCIRLRFLICSRPEPPIRIAFSAEEFRSHLQSAVLDVTFRPARDIEIFLSTEFGRIRQDPLNAHIQFPNPWPEPGVICALAHKACGQFIYAKTVVKFIDNEYSNPCTQLQIVLSPESHSGPEFDLPFRDLDLLYHQILASNPQRSKVREVIQAVMATGMLLRLHDGTSRSLATPRHVEALLELEDGEVIATLRGMHSVLHIGGPTERIQFLHASFGDFLQEKQRSGYYCVGDVRAQHHALACQLLRFIRRYFPVCNGDGNALPLPQREIFHAAWAWAYHVSACDLDVELLDAIQSVDFSAHLGLYFSRCLFDTYFMGNLRNFFWGTQALLEKHAENTSSCEAIKITIGTGTLASRWRCESILLQPPSVQPP